MVNGLLFQPALSVALTLASFAFMIWPGYAILHLLGFGRHRWAAAIYAGPALTLGLLIIALSGAAWAAISLREIATPVWIVMLFLAALGLALRASVRAHIESDNAWTSSLLWMIAALLPFLLMPSIFRYGLGIFASSTFPDGWSYVTMADYLTHVARGTEGGLSPLHQYASHMMNVRNASSALMAGLAIEFGVRSDEVMSLYCLLILFANGCASIAFARTVFPKPETAVTFLLVSGTAVPALIIYFANLDQLLLLPLMPLTAAIALRASRDGSASQSAIIIGILMAASILAYVEMAFLGLLVALSFIASPDTRFRSTVMRATLVACIAIPVAVTLTWPSLMPLIAMLKGQYVSAQAAVRPGEGFLEGVLARFDFVRFRWVDLPLLFLLAIVMVAAVGIWLERKRWLSCLALLAVALISTYFVFPEKYLYGTYKIASVNFWIVSFFLVIGLERIAGLGSVWLSPSIRTGISVAAIVLLPLFAGAVARTVDIRLSVNGVQQQHFREAVDMANIAGDNPMLISVRDDLANQWAVLYLSDTPTLIGPYRIYMAQPHVLLFMARAKPVELASIRYIVTDHDDAIRSSVTGARIIRDGQIYSLWQVDGDDWTVTAEGGVHNDRVHLSGREPSVKAQVAIGAR